VRANALFNRLLDFPGTVVDSVSFSGPAIIVQVRLRSKVLVCPCGRQSYSSYDSSCRRWRHLDLGRWKVYIQARIRRVDCRGCGQVRTEWTSWARPGARHTRDFENTAGWLVKRMSKTATATLLRSNWHTIDAIVTRLVTAHLQDADRFDGLRRIGVDEIAYRKGRKFLTIVTDHDTGRVVWLAEGRSAAALATFYELLGPAARARIQAVTMDMTRIYREPTRQNLPNAAICFDPFHVIKWAGDTLEQAQQGLARPTTPLAIGDLTPAQTTRKIRATLRAAAEDLDDTGHAIITQLGRRWRRLWRGWQLKEQLRDLYRTVDPAHAATHLKKWITAAKRCTINGFNTLGRRIHRNFDGIINAIQNRLSNSLTEGLNAGIRLIQRRAHGYANLANLTTMIHLCHGGIPTPLPTETH
jgi:transposase